jgi:hypothetical protein
MLWTPCDCGLRFLVRLNRELWMRLVPGRRHYYCVRCRSHELLSREGLRRLFPAAPSELLVAETAAAPLEEEHASGAQASTTTRAKKARRSRIS